MYPSEQACQAFNLLREVQDIKEDLLQKRQHMDERVYAKSIASLDDMIVCCSRIIDKHLNITWQDILRMRKEVRNAFSFRIQ